MQLIFSGKDRHTLHSGRWNRGYNPDLCIVSKNHNGVSLQAQQSVLNNFPKSQHRPVRKQIGIQIPLVKTSPKPRWNFRKANWTAFSKSLDDNIRWIDPIVNNYERFISMVKGTAKRYIPGASDINISLAGMRKATDCIQNIKGMAKQKLRTNS